MTWDDWESYQYIRAQVNHHYKSGGRHLTKEQAVAVIRANRDSRWFPPGFGWPEKEKNQRLCVRFYSYELIRIIRECEHEDPIWCIWIFINRMDDILTRGEWSTVWKHAKESIEAVKEILEVLH